MSVCASPQAAPPCPRVTPGKEWEGSARRLLGETNTAISRYSGNVSLMQRRELCDDASRLSPVPLCHVGKVWEGAGLTLLGERETTLRRSI